LDYKEAATKEQFTTLKTDATSRGKWAATHVAQTFPCTFRVSAGKLHAYFKVGPLSLISLPSEIAVIWDVTQCG